MSEAVRALLRAVYIGHQEIEYEEELLKLSVIERQLMGLLMTKPGQMTKDLAAFFAVQTTTMASILDRLKDSGLIERHQHTLDKRATEAVLTDKGRLIIEGIRQRDVENCRGILAELTENRRADFVEDLEKMARKLEA